MNILYEDNHLLILDKIPNLLTHGDETGDPTLLDMAKEYIKVKYAKPGDVFLSPANRLDRPVSGIVIMAKTSKALARMNAIFKNREIQKTYVAIVEGTVLDSHAHLKAFIQKDHKKNISKILLHPRPNAKSVSLTFQRKAVIAGKSLLEISLDTGRSHQIRAQLADYGHPIVGDLKYGATLKMTDRSVALHCTRVQFIHPVKKDPLSISSRLPRDGFWQAFQGFQ